MTAPGGFWRPQARRRLAVSCLYGGVAAGLILCALTSRGRLAESVGLALMVLSLAGVLFGVAGILQSRRTLFLSGSGRLDERQQSVRDRAYYTAYRALGLIVIASAVYLGLVLLRRLAAPALSPTEIALVVASVVLLVLTLPAAVMAWSEADPPEDSGSHVMVNRGSLST